MRKILLTLLVAGLVLAASATPVTAQTLGDQYLTATSADCSTAGSCAAFQPGFVPSTTLTISGTFTATVTFEATADGINWTAVQAVNVSTGANSTSATSGTFSITNSGFLQVRARVSAYTSGTVKVTATRGVASARLLTPTFGSLTTTGIIQSGSNIQLPAGSAVLWNGRSAILSPSDGVLEISNNAATDFTRLQFGGTTSAFPSIKRVGQNLQVQLADDSGATSLTVGNLTATGQVQVANRVTFVNSAPSFNAGFGTSPVLVAGTTTAFTWNVGTGGAATTGTINTGSTASTGYTCNVSDLANAATNSTVQTATTASLVSFASFSRTTGAALAWPSGAVISISCVGY